MPCTLARAPLPWFFSLKAKRLWIYVWFTCTCMSWQLLMTTCWSHKFKWNANACNCLHSYVWDVDQVKSIHNAMSIGFSWDFLRHSDWSCIWFRLIFVIHAVWSLDILVLISTTDANLVRNRSIYLELIAANAFFVIQLHHVSFLVAKTGWFSAWASWWSWIRRVPGPKTPYFAPWIKGRCEIIGPHQEKTTAIYVPISQATGIEKVRFTWAGTFVLEALCLAYPTVNFALIDSDCASANCH